MKKTIDRIPHKSKYTLKISPYQSSIQVPNPEVVTTEKKQICIQKLVALVPNIRTALAEFAEAHSLGKPMDLKDIDSSFDYNIEIAGFGLVEDIDPLVDNLQNGIDLLTLNALLAEFSDKVLPEQVDHFVFTALKLFNNVLIITDFKRLKLISVNNHFLKSLQTIINIFDDIWPLPKHRLQLAHQFISFLIKLKFNVEEMMPAEIKLALEFSSKNMDFLEAELVMIENTVSLYLSANPPSGAMAISPPGIIKPYIQGMIEKSIVILPKLMPYLLNTSHYEQWVVFIAQCINHYITHLHLENAEKIVKLAMPIIESYQAIQPSKEVLFFADSIETNLTTCKLFTGEKPNITSFTKKLKKIWGPITAKDSKASPPTKESALPLETPSLKKHKKKQKKKHKSRTKDDILLPSSQPSPDESKLLKKQLKITKKQLEKASSRSTGLQAVLDCSQDELKKAQQKLEKTEEIHQKTKQELEQTEQTHQKAKQELEKMEQAHQETQQTLIETELALSHEKEKLKIETEITKGLSTINENLSGKIQELRIAKHHQTAIIRESKITTKQLQNEKLLQQEKLKKLSQATQVIEQKTQESAILQSQLAGQAYVSMQLHQQLLQTEAVAGGLMYNLGQVCEVNQLLQETINQVQVERAHEQHHVEKIYQKLHEERVYGQTAKHKAVTACRKEIDRLSKNPHSFPFAGGTDRAATKTKAAESTPPQTRAIAHCDMARPGLK